MTDPCTWLRPALLIVAATLFSARPAAAQKKPKPEAAPVDAQAQKGGQKAGQKTKTYTFGGLDIDGKLKTPQLLYFLNRMKSEFDSTTPERRSFMPELARSPDEM